MVLRLSSFPADVRSVVLTGLSTAFNSTVTALDTVLSAIGKLAAQVVPVAANIGRNQLLNGLFSVQQRGAGPWTASGAFTADRWAMSFLSDTDTLSIVALADADRAAIGDEAAEYALQCVIAGAAGNAYSQLAQTMEDVRRLGNKTVVVSFWAKASVAANIGICFSQVFGSGGSPSASVNTAPAVVGATTSWARLSASFALASTAGKTLGSNANHGTQVILGFSASGGASPILGVSQQSATFQIWGLQVEIGTVASPLEKRPAGLELALCQRQCIALPALVVSGYVGIGGGVIANQVLLPVTMRAAPTVTYSGQTYSNCSGFATQAVRATDLVVQATVGTLGGTATAQAAALLSCDL